jgi:hypothetical protein
MRAVGSAHPVQPRGPRPAVRRRLAGGAAAAALLALLLLAVFAPRPAAADEYDPEDAGNPVRIIAYALHPIGVAFDWLVMRPARWVVEREPFRTLFGNED